MKRVILPAALGLVLVASPRVAAEIPLTTTSVATGLSSPLYLTAPPGDTSRLFIVEKGMAGTAHIKILDLASGTVLEMPFLKITGISTTGERGLLGLAFHPEYATNGLFYVYVSDTPASNSVWCYTVSADPNAAEALSKQAVLVMGDPYSSHNGGWIAFGPDAYLYIATGDGGAINDPDGNGQNIDSLLGKMLRIDVNGDDFPEDPDANYAVPPTNPFAGAVPGSDEIWHYGLRNPWRNSFDRSTGDLYIGDVGQDGVEEVDFQAAGVGGLNFGWRCMEGNSCTGLAACACDPPDATDPVLDYSHTLGCSVTGGYVYRGDDLCGMQGTYFCADYCSNAVWSFRYVGGVITDFTNRAAELDPPGSASIATIASFGEDADGELYILDLRGEIFKVVPAPLVDCNGNSVHDSCDIENATSADVNGNEIPDECEAVVDAICFGDGSSGDCPCSNTGGTGRGCENSASVGGAQLSYTGLADLSWDSFVITASGELPAAFTIFLQGNVEIAPAIFGDGLRCAGGHLYRLYAKSASGGTVTAPIGTDPSVSARSSALGDSIAPGNIRIYHTYYRDPVGSFCPEPTGKTFNSSGGLRVHWVP